MNMFKGNGKPCGIWQDARGRRERAAGPTDVSTFVQTCIPAGVQAQATAHARNRDQARTLFLSSARAAGRVTLIVFAFALCMLPSSFVEESLAASFTGGMYNAKSQTTRQNLQAQAARQSHQGEAAQAGYADQAAAQAAELNRGAVSEVDSRSSGKAGLQVWDANSINWRLRILDAAAVSGPVVRLGEIAVPVGEMSEALWNELSSQLLWDAPEENGKPMSLSRPKLQQAMLTSMGRDFAMLCFYPQSLVIQRGGKVLGPAEVLDVTVKTLTPLLASLPGEAGLSDFRLPETVFLGGAQQTLELERPANVEPGRLSLKFAVRDLDGSVVKRLTGTVFVDCWAVLPVAAAPLGKDEALDPARITFERKNLAQIRVPARTQVRGAEQEQARTSGGIVSANEIWDGKGGPWRTTRAIGTGQPILIGDLAHLPTVTKGSVISLIYNAPSVRLSVKAEALADGVRGESIPVRNQSSNRQVYAVVIDDGVAVIESGFSRATANNFKYAPNQDGWAGGSGDRATGKTGDLANAAGVTGGVTASAAGM